MDVRNRYRDLTRRLGGCDGGPFMIRFSLFGIPVEIQPWFWITAALLGGGLHVSDSAGLLSVAIFVVAALASILVHELGHALVGRRLGGGTAAITLWAFGGLATNQGGRFTLRGRMAMILAGPGAGFLLFLLVAAGVCLVFGVPVGGQITGVALFRAFLGAPPPELQLEVIETLRSLPPNGWELISSLLWINFWWGILNLLPVFPLDGGQFLDCLVRPRRRVLLISAITALVVALVAGLWLQRLYMAALFGFLAWQSYSQMRERQWE